MRKSMATIRIFHIIELGGTNMKKKITKHHTHDHSEAGEQRYQQKLKVNQRLLEALFNSFSQCFSVPFYPYDRSAFTGTDSFVNQPEDNENNKSSKLKK
jgi:hypothetical protein